MATSTAAPRTNYIQRLQDELAQYKRLDRVADGYLAELVVYLNGPKFSQDTTVQRDDVLRRLELARSALGYASNFEPTGEGAA